MSEPLDPLGKCPDCGADWKGDPVEKTHPADPRRTHFSLTAGISHPTTLKVIAIECPGCKKRFPV